jgi:hypothetical protein
MGRFRDVLACLLTTAVVPAVAVAQGTTQSFDDLRRVVKVGESVEVTDDTGRKTRGTVVELRETSVVLQPQRKNVNPQPTVAFAEGSVTKIERRDRLDNGILIGLGAGILATWGLDIGSCGPPGSDPECSLYTRLYFGPVLIPAGAIAGAFIDKAISKVLYVSPAVRAKVAVVPWVTGSERGMAVSVRF